MKNKLLFRYINTALLLALICLGLYALFYPPKILDNWTLRVPEQITVGKEFDVISDSSKLAAIKGEFERSVECINSSGVHNIYTLSSGTSDRQPGEDESIEYSLIIPDSIPDLPRQCTYRVEGCYKVNIFRKKCEYAESNVFTLNRT